MKTAPDLPDRVEGPLIERLARAGAQALYDSNNSDLWMEFPGQWGDMSAVMLDGPVDMRAFVRVVLQALRDPTEDMMTRGKRQPNIDDMWRAMIDAALAPTA